jgi:hypothetical protein
MRRFRLRRLRRVNMEAMVIAAGQNIKRLLTFPFRGPRRLAQAEALRPPAPLFSVVGYPLRSHRVGDLARPSRVFQHAGAFHEGVLGRSCATECLDALGFPTPGLPARVQQLLERFAL